MLKLIMLTIFSIVKYVPYGIHSEPAVLDDIIVKP